MINQKITIPLKYGMKKHVKIFQIDILIYAFIISKKLHAERKTYPEIHKALMAIPHHYSDGPGKTLDQREIMHLNCDPNLCAFKKITPAQKKDFVPMNTEGFAVAGDFFDYPDTFDQVLLAFESQSSESRVMASSRPLTQNINESLHSKLWRIVSKYKTYSLSCYNFAIQHIMICHNYGYVDGSLLPEQGGMTNTEYRVNVMLNTKRLRMAETRIACREEYGRTHYKGRRDLSTLFYIYGGEFEWDEMDIVEPPDSRAFFGDELLDVR